MTEVKVVFSHALVSSTNNQREIQTAGDSLREVLEDLTKRFGDPFKKKLFDSDGRTKRFINVYINGKDMRFMEGLETKLKNGDEILIIPAVSGG